MHAAAGQRIGVIGRAANAGTVGSFSSAGSDSDGAKRFRILAIGDFAANTLHGDGGPHKPDPSPELAAVAARTEHPSDAGVVAGQPPDQLAADSLPPTIE